MIELWIILGIVGFVAGAGQFWRGSITTHLGGLMAILLITTTIVFCVITIKAGAPWWYVIVNIAIAYLSSCIAGAIFGRRER